MRWILLGLAVLVAALAAVPLFRGGSEGTPAPAAPAPAAPAPVDPAPREPVADPPPSRPSEPDALADALATALIDIARGRNTEDDRAAMRERIAAALAQEGLGDDESRPKAAAMAVDAMSARAAAAAEAGQPIADMKLRAVKALAAEMSRELRKRLPAGAKLEHDPSALRAIAPEVPVPEGYTAASWKLLAGFPYREGQPLPAEVRALDGKSVGVTGYMIVLDEGEDGIRELLLVQSLWDCCFGVPPELHQGIVVKVPSSGLRFSSKPVLVLGRLQVGEDRDKSGFVLSVYRVAADRVTELD